MLFRILSKLFYYCSIEAPPSVSLRYYYLNFLITGRLHQSQIDGHTAHYFNTQRIVSDICTLSFINIFTHLQIALTTF